MATDAVPETYACSVCSEIAPAAMTAECNWCDQRFHLNQRNDVEGKDCGQVWIDEQYLALQFACSRCLAEGDGAGVTVPKRRTDGRPRRYRRRA